MIPEETKSNINNDSHLNEVNDVNLSHIQFDSSNVDMDENIEMFETPQHTNMNLLDGDIEVATSEAVVEEELDEEQMKSVLSLCETTGCEFEDAQKLLKDVNWDISNAIGTFFERQDINAIVDTEVRQVPRSVQMPPRRPLQPLGNTFDSSPGFGENFDFQSYISRFRQPTMHDNDDDNDDDDIFDVNGSPKVRDVYDEEGIRRPDKVKQQRLVGGNSSYGLRRDDSTSRADDSSVEWLYDPPRHLSCPLTFLEAKTMAKNDRKWLLVNIQSHTEFMSSMLNRDTWSNETVESLIRNSFIFWQRGHTSRDAQEYMKTYRLNSDTDLPTIELLDSRTGSRILVLKVRINYIIHDDSFCFLTFVLK